MAASYGGAGGAPSVRGLRLLTMNRGADGYGFHMYTDKKLQVCFRDTRIGGRKDSF